MTGETPGSGAAPAEPNAHLTFFADVRTEFAARRADSLTEARDDALAAAEAHDRRTGELPPGLLRPRGAP